MFNVSFLEFFKPILEIMKSLWLIWIIIAVIILLRIFFWWLRGWVDKRRTKKWFKEHKTLEEWKRVDPKKFEKITAIIFSNLGYKTKIVGGKGDWGVDVIARKDGKRNFIQCKRMDKVRPSAIRDFYGSIIDRLCEGEKGFFVTTGEFTEEGKEFAKDRPIELIDGLKLENLARS